METRFASPERASHKQLQSDIEHTKGLPLVKDLTNMIPDAFVILNQHRQIVYCNTALRRGKCHCKKSEGRKYLKGGRIRRAEYHSGFKAGK